VRHFLSLSANRIERAGAAAASGPSAAQAPPPSLADMPTGSSEDDDLPF
jgi:hypothetical protein